jgi:hypothetical protein
LALTAQSDGSEDPVSPNIFRESAQRDEDRVAEDRADDRALHDLLRRRQVADGRQVDLRDVVREFGVAREAGEQPFVAEFAERAQEADQGLGEQVVGVDFPLPLFGHFLDQPHRPGAAFLVDLGLAHDQAVLRDAEQVVRGRTFVDGPDDLADVDDRETADVEERAHELEPLQVPSLVLGLVRTGQLAGRHETFTQVVLDRGDWHAGLGAQLGHPHPSPPS